VVVLIGEGLAKPASITNPECINLILNARQKSFRNHMYGFNTGSRRNRYSAVIKFTYNQELTFLIRSKSYTRP